MRSKLVLFFFLTSTLSLSLSFSYLSLFKSSLESSESRSLSPPPKRPKLTQSVHRKLCSLKFVSSLFRFCSQLRSRMLKRSIPLHRSLNAPLKCFRSKVERELTFHSLDHFFSLTESSFFLIVLLMILQVSSFRCFPSAPTTDAVSTDLTALEGGETGGVPLSRIDREAQVGSLTWIVDVPAGESTPLFIHLLMRETDDVRVCFHR